MLTPESSYWALLAVQALHLMHHRAAKRHISYAEVTTAVVLCVPPGVGWVPPIMLMTVQLALITVQVIGSAWIRPLSPTWAATKTS